MYLPILVLTIFLLYFHSFIPLELGNGVGWLVWLVSHMVYDSRYNVVFDGTIIYKSWCPPTEVCLLAYLAVWGVGLG